jgi:hypothetical protein
VFGVVDRHGLRWIEFPLPAVRVSVLAYLTGAASEHQGSHYAGLKDEHVLWMHG